MQLPFTLDEWIVRLAKRIDGLTPSSASAFFALWGERLLPLYVHFVRECGWGDVDALRGSLDAIWGQLIEGSGSDWAGLARRLDAAKPHVDDFDNVLATLAQDACICVEASLAAASNGQFDAGAVEFVVEALRVPVCVQLTGFLDLGGAPERAAFETRLMHDPRFRRMHQRIGEDLVLLESPEARAALPALRRIAREGSWNPQDLLRDPFASN